MEHDEGIHSVHPYPCKFPSSFVREFVCADVGQVLVDPFCGSGTTLVEAAKAGWKQVYGFDSNPIATMVARFKMLPAGPRFFLSAEATLRRLRSKLHEVEPISLRFDGDRHWFDARVLRDIAKIRSFIDSERSWKIRLWLSVALSRIVNKVSRQESETRYVAVLQGRKVGSTLDEFIDGSETILSALENRGTLAARSTISLSNVRLGTPLLARSVDRIVTSPPYANTMDYYLYHKQRMNVLGFDFRSAQQSEVGSRHEYSSRRATVEKWEADYQAILAEFKRILRPGGQVFLVIGDSQLAGSRIDAAELTARLASPLGFSIDLLRSTSMAGRSRSFSHGFQRPGKREHVLALT